jgi:3-hydroxyisobutyrate dehydrogenase/2-hydroxy-3-oxopropionate reductase
LAVSSVSSVAVIGTGRMGGAMVARLQGAGHSVTVYNRTPSRAAATGAAVASNSREAAAAADIVITSLPDDAAVEAVYGSLLEGLRPGSVVLETSTIHPDTVRALAPEVEARSATLLDAPVSGSVPVVERGQLTFMVGGPAEALDRARPVLECLAAQVYHLGPVGAGATMKLAVNAVVHALNQALSEALVLVEKSGVDREAAYDVLSSSAVAAPYVHYKREAFLHPESAPVAFALSLAAKDLALIDSLATSVGARMDQLATNRRIVLEALSFGYAERDLSALADLLRTESTPGDR